MVKICLVCIVNRNFGDAVIADCAEGMIRRCIPRKYRNNYRIIRYNMKRDDPLLIKNSDMVIFAGGGIIKYHHEKYMYENIPKIISWAKEGNTPVYFNSVGIEGYDETDENCISLKKALNEDIVKCITARENYSCLRDNYIDNSNILTYPAIDTAVFSAKYYDNAANPKSKTIGLGIIRPGIFEEYGRSTITEEVQINFWKDTVKAIEKKGYKWKFFVNGAKDDYDFACKILKLLKKDNSKNKYLSIRPAFASELVDELTSFCGIIAGRMHSCIIATAFGIPAIGLNWNDKIPAWFERINYPDRVIGENNFNADTAVEKLVNAMDTGVKIPGRRDEKKLIEPLKKFIGKYCTVSESADSKEYWTKKLVAIALGSVDGRYFNMNNKAALTTYLKYGFRNFETDIRITSDNKLVCINSWAKESYERLGIEAKNEKYTALDAVTYFCSSYYDSHFDVLDFPVFTGMIQYEDIDFLMLDIGKPGVVTAEKLLQKLDRDMSSKRLREITYIRVSSLEVLELCDKYIPDIKIAYHIAAKNYREENQMDYHDIAEEIQKHNVGMVTFTNVAGLWEDEALQYFRDSSLKMCIFACNTYENIKLAEENKFDLIGTSFCNIDDADALIM